MLEQSLSKRCKWILIALIAMLCIAAANWFVWRDLGRPTIGADDANIFFVYARNIIHSHGIVYNVGGEHVDGASSLLYLLICCFVWLLTPRPELTLYVFNFLCVAAICAIILSVFRKIEKALSLPRHSSLLLFTIWLVWLLLNPSFYAWTIISLMDSGLYSLMLASAFAMLAHWLLSESPATLRHAALLSVVLMLTMLARPEGVAWGLLESLLFMAAALRPSYRTTRAIWLPFLALICGYLGMLVFRKLYFGYPLPNTYYAKVSANRWISLRSGIHYLHTFVRFYGVFLFLPLLFAFVWMLLLLRKRSLSPLFYLLLLTTSFISLGLLLPVLEGGEHFNGFRMYQPIYPFLAVAVALTMLPLLKRNQRIRATAITAFITLLFAFTTQSTWTQFAGGNRDPNISVTDSSVRIEFAVANRERLNGYQLRTIFSPNLPTVGDAAAGGFTYTYHGTVFDLMGLNNTRMAHANPIKVGYKDHASFDKGVFYSLAPQIFMPVTQLASTPVDLHAVMAHDMAPQSFEHGIYKDIFGDTRFQTEYMLALIQSPQHPELTCYGFFRRDFLSQLLHQQNFRLLQSE